jgi:hypothetical protein
MTTLNTTMRIVSAYCAAMLLVAGPAFAADDGPIGAVNTFFEALSSNDAPLAATVMIDDGVLYGYVEGADGLRLVRMTISEYIDAMASRTDSLLERIWDVQVLEEDRLAMAWTPYDFYVNGAFHHCGVNSFNLIRADEGWKIAAVVYSMKTASCDESPLGPPGFPPAN